LCHLGSHLGAVPAAMDKIIKPTNQHKHYLRISS
jgi:hypothetical protein